MRCLHLGVVFDSVRTDSIPAHMNLFSDPDQLIINALRRSFKRLVDLRSARYLLLEYFSDVTCARGCLEGEGCDRPNITLPKSQDSILSVQVDLLRDGFVIHDVMTCWIQCMASNVFYSLVCSCVGLVNLTSDSKLELW